MTDLIDTNTRGQGHRIPSKRRLRIATRFVSAAAIAASTVGIVTYQNDDYQDNLEMIRAQTVRNRLHDDSDYRDVKQADLVQADHLGDSSVYPENYPTASGGQFRTACEFSHFAYDDPVLFPDQPGAAHLHVFFGNTDTNAYSTQETLEDSGSGTCNGQELNRSGYWIPAMMGGDGDVRIPERILIYYKGENWANSGDKPTFGDGTPNAGSQIYERGMRNISPMPDSVPEVSSANGGLGGFSSEVNYKCTTNRSGPPVATGVNNIPFCDGSTAGTNCNPNAGFGFGWPNFCRKVLEMEIKFWNCFPSYDEANPNDPNNPVITDHTLWAPSGTSRGNWFLGDCTGHGTAAANQDNQETYPHFSYFVNYVVEPGETTADWFLSSDVDTSTLGAAQPSLLPGGAGFYHHGDAWWEWHDETLQEALDECINFSTRPVLSGCGEGFLENSGPDGDPATRPIVKALQLRPDFDTVGNVADYRVPASQIFNELCVPLGPTHSYSTDEHAAYCKP